MIKWIGQKNFFQFHNVRRQLYTQCNSIVRPRQEALQCDGCQRWQHRICNTGKYCFIIIINYGSVLESAWAGCFPGQTWLQFGIGSRLLKVLYVKSKKKHKCRFVFLRCRIVLLRCRIIRVPIYLVPKCLAQVPKCPGADLSRCRSV